MTEQYARRYLTEQAALDERRLGKWHGFAVEHLAEHTVIGDIGVFLQVDPELSGDAGFQFHPAYHRQGYGYEAMAPFLVYLFEGLGLRTVTANCDPANVASKALIGRLGLHPVPGPAGQFSLDRDEWVSAG